MYGRAIFICGAGLCLLLLRGGNARCADTPTQTFEKQIRPLFAARCFDCHSAQADDLKGGLKLDTLGDLLRGGASGKAVLPGDVENSFLLRAIRYQEDDYQMPPSGKLPKEEIERLEKWVRELQAADLPQ